MQSGESFVRSDEVIFESDGRRASPPPMDRSAAECAEISRAPLDAAAAFSAFSRTLLEGRTGVSAESVQERLERLKAEVGLLIEDAALLNAASSPASVWSQLEEEAKGLARKVANIEIRPVELRLVANMPTEGNAPDIRHNGPDDTSVNPVTMLKLEQR
jgi:hypothetical protein